MAITAGTLGCSPAAIDRLATDSAVAHAQYVAATGTVRKSP
ncbi:hypothetical protein [Arthrobacter sp. SDTb3-6]|nr:hypothetical protein [Arthrobacter sp. SDTb3-6]